MLNKVEENIIKETCENHVKSLLKLSDSFPVYLTSQVLSKELGDFYKKTIKLQQLCCDTVKQSLCDNWFKARRLRVSASKHAHNIKSAVRRSADSLVIEMLYPKNIDTPAMKYRRDNEENARREYEILFNVSVIKIGVIISKYQHWLCASL